MRLHDGNFTHDELVQAFNVLYPDAYYIVQAANGHIARQWARSHGIRQNHVLAGIWQMLEGVTPEIVVRLRGWEQNRYAEDTRQVITRLCSKSAQRTGRRVPVIDYTR